MQSVSSAPSVVRSAACVCETRKRNAIHPRDLPTTVDPFRQIEGKKLEPCTFSREIDPPPPFLLVGGGGCQARNMLDMPALLALRQYSTLVECPANHVTGLPIRFPRPQLNHANMLSREAGRSPQV